MSAEPITFKDFEAIKEFALDLGSALAADLKPEIEALRAERDRARDLASALEAELAREREKSLGDLIETYLRGHGWDDDEPACRGSLMAWRHHGVLYGGRPMAHSLGEAVEAQIEREAGPE